MIESTLLQRLRLLVGKRVEYSGHTCRVIEILNSEKTLVLRCEGKQSVIQGNQFGEATRRVQQCHTLYLFDDSGSLNPVINEWLV